MCGIVGYIGKRNTQDILLEGLRRLEYRGYDSVGIAVAHQNEIKLSKKAGRVNDLANALSGSSLVGKVGIGHTRWATHGAPTDENAHPHIGCYDVLALVHNGVVENHHTLRENLKAQGVHFKSQTDSEVIAHLLASHYQKQKNSNQKDHQQIIIDTIEITTSQLKGTYGLAVIFYDSPDFIAAVRFGSPLVVGIAENEHYVASDAAALAGWANEVVYMQDNEIAIVSEDSLHVVHRDHGTVQPNRQTLQMSEEELSKQGYDHFMLKEIFEQPDAIANAMRGRFDMDEATAHFGGLNLSAQQLRNINRIVLTACGTSWHAGLVGECLIEELARIPVEVEYASEFRYRNAPMDPGTLIFAITQSGETADTLAALKESKRKGYPTLAICNVVGSSIAREADGGIYLYAGPEIGVASTKAFTAQVTVLTLLALYLGRLRHLSFMRGAQIIEALQSVPDLIKKALECNAHVKKIAEKYQTATNMLYLGRHYNFPTALEGALKLKEISYIHAEGYPAAEMKHGPIALVDEHTPSVFVLTRSPLFDKVMSNVQEIKARGGPVIGIACEGDTEVEREVDDVIYVPKTPEYLQPLVTVIPMQLLAYHIAVLRGCDVDKPRNLAKSVTVE